MAFGTKVGVPLASSGLYNDVDSTQRNPLGARYSDDLGNTFIYLQGIGSLAAGDWVVWTGGRVVTRMLNTPLSGPAAVAMAAVLANKFGWFQIVGVTPATTNIASDVSGDGLALFQSATAGRASTSLAAGCAILGAWAYGAPASNVGPALINNPFCPGFELASA